MYFRKYWLQKTWLDKCQKICASEGPLTGNMANGSKHSWNLSDSIFAMFINHCKGNCIGKSLF